MDSFKVAIRRASFLVFAFAAFTIFSILCKCIPEIVKFFDNSPDLESPWLFKLLNLNINIPLEIIAGLWAAISAAYIGVDRAAMTISTVNGEYEKTDYGDPACLKRVILCSFSIYMFALFLNFVFDADLALMPFATSFGSSVLLYVTGQKAIYAASKIAPEEDVDQNGIKDEEEHPPEIVGLLKKAQNLDDEKLSKLQTIADVMQRVNPEFLGKKDSHGKVVLTKI